MFNDIFIGAAALAIVLFALAIDRKARSILAVLIEIERNTRPPK